MTAQHIDTTVHKKATTTVLPTGAQYTIQGDTAFGHATVTITQLAAALRAFEVDGVDIVQRYPVGSSPSLGAGMVMVPWPNRIADGRWNHHGEMLQLDISEPKFDNALHGLLAYTAYSVASRTSSSITLTAPVFAHPGYPFVLETSVDYALNTDGLTVRHRLTNRGRLPAPVAVGTHGYYKIGGVDTGELMLTNSARTVYTNDSRLLPVARVPVSGRFDLREGRKVANLALDDCFTDQSLIDGCHRSRLTAPDGRHVEVWTDENFGHVVLLTTRQFVAENGQEALAVAIEPQTAAADSFNNGFGLVWLDPGASWSPTWGVTAQLG